MRIFVISDTHGHLERARAAYEKVNSQAPVDVVVHCGDHIIDAMQLESDLGVKVVACYGNCDSGRMGNDSEILETECGSFFITHGDEYGVNYDLSRLGYKAEEQGCIGAIFGHTHMALFVRQSGIVFLNPGSLTRPRDGSGGTFALLETDAKGMQGRIIRYEDMNKL